MDTTMSNTAMFNTAIICSLLLQLSILSIICGWCASGTLQQFHWIWDSFDTLWNFVQTFRRIDNEFRMINWILWIILLDIGCILCSQFFNKKNGFCWIALRFFFLHFPSINFYFFLFFRSSREISHCLCTKVTLCNVSIEIRSQEKLKEAINNAF